MRAWPRTSRSARSNATTDTAVTDTLAAEAREKEKQIEQLKVTAVVFINDGVAKRPAAEHMLDRRPVGEDTDDEGVHTDGETMDVATKTAVAGNAQSTTAVAEASGSEVERTRQKLKVKLQRVKKKQDELEKEDQMQRRAIQNPIWDFIDSVSSASETACEAKEAGEGRTRGRRMRRARARSRGRRRERGRSRGERNSRGRTRVAAVAERSVSHSPHSRARGRTRQPRHCSRSRSRSRGPEAEITTTHFVGLQRGLVRRPAIVPNPHNQFRVSGRCAASPQVPPGNPPEAPDEAPDEPLPASVGHGNLMIATWVLGVGCDGDELGNRLAIAPFDCIVLVLSTAVVDTDCVYTYLRELSDMQWMPHEDRETHMPASMAAALAEKTIFRLGEQREDHAMYVALHKAKVMSARYCEMQNRSRGAEGLQFGTLCLSMDLSRQRMATVTVGIIDVRRKMEAADVEALTQWVVLDRIAMLTGFFGCCPDTHTFVAELAVRTRAVSLTPMYQAVKPATAVAGRWLHPSFFLLYGFFRQITVPEEDVAVVPQAVYLGDIWDDMLPLSKRPQWNFNQQGSAFVHNLGNVKMKAPDWRRWFNYCFQTCLWLGTATPSKASQLKKGNSKGNSSRGHHQPQSRPSSKQGTGKGKW